MVGTAQDLQPDLLQRIRTVLEQVPDPELPVVSLVDLGIVREVACAEDGRVVVRITPTYTGCPATLVIQQSVRAALDEAGYSDVILETVLSPPWSTDMITDAGREKLRAYGIAPPGARQEAVACPRCGSTETREVSRFGSTPCKALWQCGSCSEPFDYFKCH
ncbi:phenylacetate-CoA oxygenase subunit PaaJ [Altererythrobacter soli]|uniref:Phenylacetate-CoA oxygenase subunit PaaJ n=1 Tax=Croceibacterium soli TaxID=1739690 RepID=A0A6I4URS8_9SPHN|nr:1,2-phenylacetyl-CoA epoxidase subunit PaaD [Croceibacterium soli]MXP41348.1 phenylacetate-CoA oxygenase subunit PaaJ [Croceibacterium soli]